MLLTFGLILFGSNSIWKMLEKIYKKREERGRANHPSSAQQHLPFSPLAPAR